MAQGTVGTLCMCVFLLVSGPTPRSATTVEQRVPIEGALVEGFRIDPLSSDPVPAGVGDLSYLQGVRINAIVGLDVLVRTSFAIDYRAQRVRFAFDRAELG